MFVFFLVFNEGIAEGVQMPQGLDIDIQETIVLAGEISQSFLSVRRHGTERLPSIIFPG